MRGQNQSQRAGAGASQIQVTGDYHHHDHSGITEERALQIAQAEAQRLIEQYAIESQPVSAGRIAQLDARVVRLLAAQELLDALAQPAFQVSLRKAQIGAASTDRTSDYDLLAGLLAERAARGSERPLRAGVNRAIEVVDQLDEDALAGITVFEAVTRIIPSGRVLSASLAKINDTLALVMPPNGALPVGREWLDHLDILDAVRVDPVQSFRDFDEYIPDQTPGFISEGVAEGSDAHLRALEKLRDVHVDPSVLVAHELKPGFLRIASPGIVYFERGLRKRQQDGTLTENQVDACLDVARSEMRMTEIDATLRPAFIEEWVKHPTLNDVREWWKQFPVHFYLTVVGKSLARANQQRLDLSGVFLDLEND